MEAKEIKEIEHFLYCKIMIPYRDKKVYNAMYLIFNDILECYLNRKPTYLDFDKIVMSRFNDLIKARYDDIDLCLIDIHSSYAGYDIKAKTPNNTIYDCNVNNVIGTLYKTVKINQ